MPSSYTTNLGIEKIGTGEQTGTWGQTTNANFDLIDQAVNGVETIVLATAGTTGSPNNLPITQAAVSSGRNKMVIFSDGGDLGGTTYVQLTPSNAEKLAHVRNSLSGGQDIVVFQGTYDAGRSFTVPNGRDMLLSFSGTGATSTVTDVFANFRATSVDTVTLKVNGTTVTATAAELNVLDGLTATTAELNYVDGVTSNIQTQLNSKAVGLVSGSTIKTLASVSLLGSGDIALKTVGGTSLIGAGDIAIAGQVYPATGIAVSTGSSWSASLTAPSGALVGTTATQTLTAKTLTNPTVTTGTFTNSTLNTPTVTNPAVTTGTFTNPAVTTGTFTNPAVTTGTFTNPTITTGTLTNSTITTPTVTGATISTSTLEKPVINEDVQVISTNTTAVRSRVYTITASLTLTLPATPAAGDWVAFSNQSNTTTAIIGANGANIMGVPGDMTIDNVSYFGTLVYADATRGWIFK